MSTNQYFPNLITESEQNLLDDLNIESIKIYGHDIYYINRSTGALDDLLNEDDLPIYNTAYPIEIYIKNVEGFEGEGDFLSKFGLEIRDSMTLTVSRKRFSEDVGINLSESRPFEGDLIYFPLNNKIFKIMHVEHESVFFQLGKLYTYDIKCELFEYSNERFETGITAIDSLFENLNTTANTDLTYLENTDTLADNLTIETEANTVLDWSEVNPFGEDVY